MRLAAVSLAACFLASTGPWMPAAASSGGYTGASTTGCVGCHGASADPNMSLSLTGPATLVAGESGTYTLTATKSGVSGQPMGLDVSTSDGTGLATIAGQSTKLLGQEITHMSPPRTVSGTTGTYQFTFNMPAGAGAGTTHTLRAASVIDYPGGWRTTTFTVTTVAPSGTRYVNAAVGVDSGSCTAANPCKTITFAMGVAATGNPGDTVSVAPGTYNMALGEVFPIGIKNGVTLVGQGLDPTAVVVDAAASNNRVFDVGSANASTRIEGFTIRGGRVQAGPGTDGYGGAMTIFPAFAQPAEIRILRNLFVDNEVRGGNGDATYLYGNSGWGGAIAVAVSTGAAPLIANNLFVDNRAIGGNGFAGYAGGAGLGGAIYAEGSGSASPNAARIINNTFHDNLAQGGNGGSASGAPGGDGGSGVAGAIYAKRTILRNNIYAGNTAAGGTPGTGSPAGAAGAGFAGSVDYGEASVTSTNNLFFASTPTLGDELGSFAVQSDPFFHAAPSNLHIASSSPAAGAGNATDAPVSDLDNVTRPSPPSIGAYEPTAVISYNLVLEGYQQVGPYVATPATGSGTATYNPASRQLTFNLAYSGLTGTESMAHVHGPAARGANAGILHNLSGANPKTGTVTLTASQEQQLLAGELYVNIHTSTYGNGELRAQIDNLGATLTRALTVSKAGTGGGTVSGTTEAGTVVSCGVDCSEAIPDGKVAALTATAGAGSIFTGWSGACAGTGACNVTMDAAKSVTATFAVAAPPPPDPPRLGNISTRMQVLTGNDEMIGGFVIGGASNKTVAIVATGPSLVPFGITNALANPTLRLVRSSDQVTLVTNDDWQAAANQAQLSAAGFAPSDALEAAILVSLPPGAYTAIVEGVGGGTGVAVVGVYEVDHAEIPLINISTRGRVLTGNDVMIGGFVIQGSGPQTLAIVATGPSLAPFGIASPLANPKITLVRSSDQVVIDSNDDWEAHANASQLDA
ncbi:MAG TPA: CHRD domain-containing protein, partial [Usitatibacter sp.]|nr:CHRD domain-containing protein [Usitatibacter sp.]